MKRILTLLLAVFVFFACTGDTGTNSKNENTSSNVVGWRGAGFTPVISLERGGGLQKVTHSGNWLVLMDAWTSPVEGKSGTLTYSPRLFISKKDPLGTTMVFRGDSVNQVFLRPFRKL